MSRANYMRRWRKQRIAAGICPECGNQLDQKPDGSFYSVCYNCCYKKREYCAEWRKENPDYHRDYWVEHKEEINARRRKVS